MDFRTVRFLPPKTELRVERDGVLDRFDSVKRLVECCIMKDIHVVTENRTLKAAAGE